MKTRMEYTCPLELTHDVTKGKWKPIILWQLGKGRRSLSSLKKEILGITQKMLMEQLKELLEYGMVEKHTYAVIRCMLNIILPSAESICWRRLQSCRKSEWK